MTDTPAEVSRFFIDHGVVHDRETGKHVRCGCFPYEGTVENFLALLQGLERQLAEARANIERRPEDVVIPLALYDEINATGAHWKERAESAESQLAAQRERDGRDAVAKVSDEIREFVDREVEPLMDTVESWAIRLDAALKGRS
jgi:hypothetical protein